MFKNLPLTPISINLEYRISLLLLSNALVKSMKAGTNQKICWQLCMIECHILIWLQFYKQTDIRMSALTPEAIHSYGYLKYM